MKLLELKSLTGIRSFAAWWVIIYHVLPRFNKYNLLDIESLKLFASAGYIGVDLFFVLSGFIITYNYSEKFSTFNFKTYISFIWLRLARMYPVHFFTLVCFGIMFILSKFLNIKLNHPEQLNSIDFIKNIFLIHSWQIPNHLSWNYPAWSISCEWLAYLLFPIFIYIISKFKKSDLLIFLVLILSLAMPFFHSFWNFSIEKNAVLRIIFEFLTGVILSKLYNNNLFSLINWGKINIIVFITILISPIIFNIISLDIFFITPLFVFLIYGLSWQNGVLSNIFSSKSLIFGGNVSYSLYMIHGLVDIVLGKVYPFVYLYNQNNMIQIIAFFVYLFIIHIASVITYLFVEEPCRKIMKNILKNQKEIAILKVS